MGPTSAGASLIDNKPRKLFSHKPIGLKSFEGSSRGTFLKVPLEPKNKPTDKSKFEELTYGAFITKAWGGMVLDTWGKVW